MTLVLALVLVLVLALVLALVPGRDTLNRLPLLRDQWLDKTTQGQVHQPRKIRRGERSSVDKIFVRMF